MIRIYHGGESFVNIGLTNKNPNLFNRWNTYEIIAANDSVVRTTESQHNQNYYFDNSNIPVCFNVLCRKCNSKNTSCTSFEFNFVLWIMEFS